MSNYPQTFIASSFSGFALIHDAAGGQAVAWNVTQRLIEHHLQPFDGTVDFAGPSGETSVFDAWHATAPQVYTGTPSVLRYQRFCGETQIAGNVTANSPLPQGTATVRWRWLP